MEINGRDVRFFRSVLANCEIADASPDGDVNRLLKEQLTEGNYATSQRAAVVIIMAMSRGYETAQHVKDPAYKPRPITKEEAMSLTEPEFDQQFRSFTTGAGGQWNRSRRMKKKQKTRRPEHPAESLMVQVLRPPDGINHNGGR